MFVGGIWVYSHRIIGDSFIFNQTPCRQHKTRLNYSFTYASILNIHILFYMRIKYYDLKFQFETFIFYDFLDYSIKESFCINILLVMHIWCARIYMGFFVYTTFLPQQDNPLPRPNARAGPGHSSAAVVAGAGAHARVVTMATAVHCARILTAGDGGPPFYFPPLSPSHHPAAADISHIYIYIILPYV